jgi:hypothetical protein
MDGLTADRLGLGAGATLEQRVNAYADLGDRGLPQLTAIELATLRSKGLLGTNVQFYEGTTPLANPFAGR